MHTNVWLFSVYQPLLHRIFRHCLLFLYSCILSWERLLCGIQNVQGNSDMVCAPAPTVWALWVRFYDLPPVALWVKKTTNSTLTDSLKVSFLVKRKLFLCLLLLPIFVCCDTSGNTHFRRCCLVFKMTDTF